MKNKAEAFQMEADKNKHKPEDKISTEINKPGKKSKKTVRRMLIKALAYSFMIVVFFNIMIYSDGEGIGFYIGGLGMIGTTIAMYADMSRDS